MDGDDSASPVGKRQRTSIVDAGLLEALGEREGIVTGVVTISEISDDRRRTLLTVEVGEADDLVVLVKGGAEGMVCPLFASIDRYREAALQGPIFLSSQWGAEIL